MTRLTALLFALACLYIVIHAVLAFGRAGEWPVALGWALFAWVFTSLAAGALWTAARGKW